jgi:polyhydroxyalkanoate synthesis repressor PhaR
MSKITNYVKYPNRRIYDTDSSTYVSFAGLRKKIMAGHEIIVLDNKTKEDVTREVLISVLLEESLVREPLFSENLMRLIICFYGNPLQSTLMNHFDQSLKIINNFWATASQNANDEQNK